MITIKEKKLNLIFGKVDSAKTTVILNTLSDYIQDGDKEVLFFSPDTAVHHIEKKMHCLVNDVDMTSVKHDRKTLKPTDLTLPKGFHVFDTCHDFDTIVRNIVEFSRAGKPDMIVIDNINQLNFGIKGLSYKDRIAKSFDILSRLAEERDVTVLVSFYMLEMANWEDNGHFSTNDEENIGTMILVSREDRVVDVYDEEISTSTKFTINPKNLKLEEKATVHLN